MHSVPFWRLDCRTKSFVLGLCLGDDDLDALLPWQAISDLDGVPPELGRRNYVHSLCNTNAPIARRLNDLFDLRYVDTVLETRASDEAALRERVAGAVRAGAHRRYPALLWALSTDPRPEVRTLGRHVMCECFLVGCRYVRETPRA